MLWVNSISAGQRRDKILETLNNSGKVTVARLVGDFGVSDATVRNDLAAMEQDGLLRRIRGGAVKANNPFYMSQNNRMNIKKDEKILIAKACANLIDDGDTLMINPGTTTLYLAKELSERHNLTVVTNSVLIAQELVCGNMINVVLLGGNIDTQYQFTFGDDTVRQLQKYRANKVIIATDGISANNGLTTYHPKSVEVSSQMIERAYETIVVADNTKIGKEGFSFIAPISVVNVLVTNKHSENNSELEALRKKGVAVISS